ncbi:Histone deacetylase [Handroanthus impetiginosus]|uniref:Histone deacetylase n=1 Tax=Handroanthus impetiginosus TaxID=429701 RepID=A0A2G9HSH4_9LAMI|nr:Histone deacetylase [Handroanthus impetiginosus]
MAQHGSSSSSLPMIGEGDDELFLDGSESGWVEARTHCDHLDSLSSDLIHIPPPGTPCNRCQHPDENWLCLCCKDVLCSRFVNRHMLEHYQQQHHNVALSYSDLSVWCFSCDAYLDAQVIQALRPVYETAYILKFGNAPPFRTIEHQQSVDKETDASSGK